MREEEKEFIVTIIHQWEYEWESKEDIEELVMEYIATWYLIDKVKITIEEK